MTGYLHLLGNHLDIVTDKVRRLLIGKRDADRVVSARAELIRELTPRRLSRLNSDARDARQSLAVDREDARRVGHHVVVRFNNARRKRHRGVESDTIRTD